MCAWAVGRASWCTTGTARRCCFMANNWCGTSYNGYCGITCNACNNSWKNSAYGGDINRGGVNSCVTFPGIVIPNCNCPNYSTALQRACLVSVAVLHHSLDDDNGLADGLDKHLMDTQPALNAMSKNALWRWYILVLMLERCSSMWLLRYARKTNVCAHGSGGPKCYSQTRC